MNGVSEQQFGKDMGLLHEVVVTGKRVGADREFWKALAHDVELFKRVVELVSEVFIFDVVVDYCQTIEKMTIAGSYNWADHDFTSDNFSCDKHGELKITIKLFSFYTQDGNISSEEVLEEIKKQGYRPAEIEELLSLGASYPELQEKFPIIALGSMWRDTKGVLRVPRLYNRAVGRDLALPAFTGGWSKGSRFAMVCDD